MAGSHDDLFSALFLEAGDMPFPMTLYGDLRLGFSEPGDQAYREHGGLKVGMTKWDGGEGSPFQMLFDIRWLFPDARSATAYHLETLQAKCEGKPENQTAARIGGDCRVYSYPSGQALGAARGIFAGALGEGHQMTRGISQAIAAMPDDAFIYLFTRGPVAVKYVAVLISAKTDKSTVQAAAERIVQKIDAAFPGAEGRQATWWRKLFSR
ncbi:hypothetical protein [Methylocapsa sp. S129]|uniref:hypothetical protein n=1 Tax=Methylocapsa sp. S129 TaxID=1641869 RepID=UPI00131E2CD8|nr:hypothetical protein [Methylocapsa sp. S129]